MIAKRNGALELHAFGIVLLPMVDFEVIRKEYFKHIDKVSKQDLNRNILGKSFVYTYDPNRSFVFRSYYGNIEDCRVMSRPIDI